jgi:FtsH-binding integral membrane protein
MRYPEFQVPAAADAPVDERISFIRKTYAHLGGAVVAFVAIEAFLFSTGIAQSIAGTLLSGKFGWLIVLGLFMAVGWVANRWAESSSSVPMQYAGLGLYVVAEAIVFVPLLYMAAYFTDDRSVIPMAGFFTLLLFTALTGTVFITKQDFSFMRGALTLAGFAALGVIVASILFGFSLGLLFSGAMVLLAAGYVLYYTSNVLHHYPVGSHVAASLALFSAVALLFWYILRILMSISRR